MIGDEKEAFGSVKDQTAEVLLDRDGTDRETISANIDVSKFFKSVLPIEAEESEGSDSECSDEDQYDMDDEKGSNSKEDETTLSSQSEGPIEERSADEINTSTVALGDKIDRPKKPAEVHGAVVDRVDMSRFSSMVPNPALKFPFQLDDWQKRAVWRVENGQSVFVSAHTSAGKTVVAEYAIASALASGTK